MTRDHQQIKQQLKWVYTYISCITDQFEGPLFTQFCRGPPNIWLVHLWSHSVQEMWCRHKKIDDLSVTETTASLCLDSISICCRATRLQSSICPQAARLLNSSSARDYIYELVCLIFVLCV